MSEKSYTEGITLYGASGHGKVVLDILEAIGQQVSRVVDDNPPGDNFMGLPARYLLQI